jgi:Flp pilus assembly protein TadD
MRRLLPSTALLTLLLAACAGTGEPGSGAETESVARAVEPSLRAAAASAEAGMDWKGAAQHWRTLYARNPQDRSAALSLARALRYAGQAQAATDVLQQAILRHGREPALVAELGKAWLAADRVGLALKTLDEATRLSPQQWDVHSARGVALDTADRFGEAQEAYGRALALAPGNPTILNNLALSQAMAGRLDEAVANLLLAQDQPEAGPQTRQNLALLLALKGDSVAAGRMAAKELPAEMVRSNAAYYRWLAENAAR